MTLPKFVKVPNLPFKLARRTGIVIERDKRHGKVGGVCQGFADRFGYDVNLVRAATFIMMLLAPSGAGIFTYLFLWLILPPDYPHCLRKECQNGCPQSEEVISFHKKAEQKRQKERQKRRGKLSIF